MITYHSQKIMPSHGRERYAPIVLGAEATAAADKHGSRALAISSCHPMDLCRCEEYFSSTVWAQIGGVKAL